MSQLLKHGALPSVRGLFATMILLPMAANAAAPVYFDIGSLILYVALYALGLLAFLIAIVIERQRRFLLLLALLAYIVTPIAYMSLTVARLYSQNAEIAEEQKLGEAANLSAFSKYCKDRNRKVIARIDPQANESLAIRFDPAFTGVAWKFNAFPLREYLRDKSSLCKQGALLFLEGTYDGRYVENRGYEAEVRRYAICSHEKWTIEPELRSRYELVLGENSKRDPLPWGTAGNRWMSKSSVRLVDKTTGMTLAQDTLYFLRDTTGEATCPAALEQISQLIADTFQLK